AVPATSGVISSTGYPVGMGILPVPPISLRCSEKKGFGGGKGGKARREPAASHRRSGRRNLVADFEASFCQPLFEQPKPVVTPEPFVREHEKGHAEHVVRGCLFLAALVGGPAFPSQIFEIVPVGHAKFPNQPSYGFRLIGFELAQEKLLEGQPAKVEQSALRVGKQAADRRRSGVVYFQRTADPQTARFRPAPSIHIGVFDLVLGIDAALALA